MKQADLFNDNTDVTKTDGNNTDGNKDEHGIPPIEETVPPAPSQNRIDGVLPKQLVLVDGHALAYRSYFALLGSAMTSPKGEPTQAVFGFLKTLSRLLRDGFGRNKIPLSMRSVVVVFDPPVKTFRHAVFEDYKSGRAETPDDLPGQVRRIKELVDLMGLARLEIPGFEADDTIGTLATRAESEGIEVRILTSDRDAYQLLSERVKVLDSEGKDIGPKEVFAKYGVEVSQWVDYRSLTGDSSDNIPGAKGVGPKTAQKLLEKYKTLDYILANLETIEPKKDSEKIKASYENVLFSRELSRIVTTVHVPLDFSGTKSFVPDPKLNNMLTNLGLNSVQRELQAIAASVQTGTEASNTENFVNNTEANATNNAAPNAALANNNEDTNAPVLKTISGIQYLPWQAPSTTESVFAFQFSKPDASQAELTTLAFVSKNSGTQDSGTQNPVYANETPNAKDLKEIKRIDASDAKALAVHLIAAGINAEPFDDPILMAYVLDSANNDPARTAARYLDTRWPEKPASKTPADLTEQTAAQAIISASLLQKLPAEFTPELRALYEDVERPVSATLARMEARGILLDVALLQSLAQTFAAQMQQLETEVHALAGEEFNLSSRDQLEKILYDKLGLATGKKTGTGKRSTAVSALEPLRDEHAIVAKILEYREISKLRGTYLEPLPLLVNPRTGRLHTTFAQTVAATGRLSSINPNLQNIPVRTEVGRELRKAFVAAPGYKIVSADYSQIELRILAHMADETELLKVFERGDDIHKRTAALVLGIEPDAVTNEQRRGAKAINYGLLYGMSAHRLGRDLGIGHKEAEAFVKRYFDAFPGVNGYLQRTKKFCHENGYVQDLFGRRRYFPEIGSRVFHVREAAERAAINMPIQGTNASIIKLAMVKLEPELEKLGARLLLQVHDELVVESPENKTDAVGKIMREVMENAYPLKAKIQVDVGVGQNWFEAH